MILDTINQVSVAKQGSFSTTIGDVSSDTVNVCNGGVNVCNNPFTADINVCKKHHKEKERK